MRQLDITAILVSLLLLLCEYSAAQEIYSAGPLQASSPQGPWTVARKTEFGIVFGRAGPLGTTDSIAYANLYNAAGPLDEDGLMAEAKANVVSFFRSPNTRLGVTEFHQRRDRDYPCVSVRSAVQVFANSTLTGESASKQMRVLICQPRGHAKYGFVAGFSYTAETAIESQEAEAESFFKSVQFARAK